MKTPLRWKKQLATIAILAVIAIYQYYQNEQIGSSTSDKRQTETGSITRYEEWRSGQWVELDATVNRLLSDDHEGSRHQRFIITLDNSRTLLIAHNIDLAKRIPLKTGDTVSLRGRYEPNDRGGVVHWTHHDPQGGPGGWVEHRGNRYQ